MGSGYSSCVTLDVNEIYFSNQIDCTFIEPYPELLYSLVKEQDKERITILPNKLQDIDVSLFQTLEENDILFIDSSHVSKINSEVNYLFFEILPRLRKGVYIHIHDIFYPFEYPMKWIYEGRFWNEDYMLRNFLAFNDSFEIVQFNAFLKRFHTPLINKLMPLFLENSGSSIWLKKIK